jgi:Leucine-rich repeat (LRR) protein
LSELRVLNLANNLITAVENLNGLISLTELNLRRNLIESVHGLQHCPRLQRIFLSNNRIEKFENISSLKDANQLQELALDGNPIFHLKGYFEFCIVTCPNLKHLDLRKITPEMRDGTGTGIKDGKGILNKIDDSNGKGSDMSTDISPDKQAAANMLQ